MQPTNYAETEAARLAAEQQKREADKVAMGKYVYHRQHNRKKLFTGYVAGPNDPDYVRDSSGVIRRTKPKPPKKRQ